MEWRDMSAVIFLHWWVFQKVYIERSNIEYWRDYIAMAQIPEVVCSSCQTHTLWR